MKVEEIMSEAIVSIAANDKLSAVQQAFAANRFHHLLVVDGDGRLLSVLSDRDFFKACSLVAEQNFTQVLSSQLDREVSTIMSKRLVCLPQFTSLKEAIRLFQEKNVSCLPIVNGQNVPVGIITRKDVLAWLYDKINL